MKLVQVELVNFGPYRGNQTIDLDVTEAAPVVLIHGENMRGKTTILRAIRWALYGHVRAHDGSVIPDADFANYEVRNLGEDFEFGVKLTYDDQGSINELTRMCQAKVEARLLEPAVSASSSRTILKPRDGNPLPERDIAERVARTLHEDIADFFLFDGEMLTRFEESLRSDATRSHAVKQSIERVLGLPALQLMKRDASLLLSEADTVLRKAASRKRDATKYETEFLAKEAELKRLEQDMEKLADHKVAFTRTVRELEAELAKVESVKDIYHRRRALENEIDEYKSDLSDLESDFRARLSECWWVPLSQDIRSRIEAAEGNLANAIRSADEKTRITSELQLLNGRSSERTCPTCDQPMDAHATARIDERQRHLTAMLDALPQRDGELADLLEQKRSLQRFARANSAAERITEVDGDITRLKIRITDKQEIISDLSDSLRETPLDIAAVEATYQEQRDALKDVNRALDAAELDRSRLGGEIRQISQRIAKFADDGSPERHERDVLDALGDALECTIGSFRDEMRKEVEREASGIFKMLTTEETYTGLRIDGRYYLEIVDELDRVIKRRSAGADQIVTMSLIGALTRCAVREGPIVMDTPFGRLDRGHRDRILRWVPTLGTQVVMFVQSGEFDRERDLSILGGMIGREYRLRRVTATYTEVERLDHV